MIMKKTAILIFFIFSVLLVDAQVRPEAYLSKLPSAPGDICSEEPKGKEEFISKVNEISEQLTAELDRRREKIDAKVEANSTKMQANAMKQTGVSPELLQQMMALEKQSKGATGAQEKAYKEQKKALADQMMQQSMNISMGEVENLKKMDKAGQKAWATAYASEKNAEVMADPQKVKDENAKNMEKYKLQARQKQLSDSLGAAQNKYMVKFREIDESEDGSKLLAKIEGIRNEISRLYAEASKRETTPNQNKLEALRGEMVAAKISYCNLQTPRYIKVLAEYKSFVQSSMSAYYRLEKLSSQVSESQTGVDISPEPGEFGLGQVSGYIKFLNDVYKYNLRGQEDYTIG
jgi:hypothetical protein